MSILIRGMEMPTRCWDCLLNTYGYCMASDEHSDIIPSDAPIPEWCPLVPVPPHGDLIERKTAYDSLLDGMVMTGYQSRALDCIAEYSVPTIIPAEEGE